MVKISAIVALTDRVMIPIGITERVTTGSIRCLKCSKFHAQEVLPPGPIPIAGNTFNSTEKIITKTRPSQ